MLLGEAGRLEQAGVGATGVRGTLEFGDTGFDHGPGVAPRELERLFGPAGRERFGPLTKSWVCVRAP